MKKCSRCHQEKEPQEFHCDSSRKDKLARYCRVCSATIFSERYSDSAKRQKILDDGKRWRSENKEAHRAKTKQWKLEYKDEIEDERLQKTFGISLNQYRCLLSEQNECCAICGRHRDDFKIKFAVDHDHETGKIRGLLCRFCNQALGAFGDNLAGVQRVVDYLKKEGI